MSHRSLRNRVIPVLCYIRLLFPGLPACLLLGIEITEIKCLICADLPQWNRLISLDCCSIDVELSHMRHVAIFIGPVAVCLSGYIRPLSR